MIKGLGDMVVEWIWRLCNMYLENGEVPEDWRSAVIVQMDKDKVERNGWKNACGDIRELSP